MDLTQIEAKIRQLVDKCKHLEDENNKLNEKFQRLQHKQEIAITSVEQMIRRIGESA